MVAGPSAVTAALAVAGFPADRFVFEGFLPRRGGERSRRLTVLADESRTLVVFASPHRLLADLDDLAHAFGGERRVCVCRELTKLHEEVRRSTISEAADEWRSRQPRGEYTLVIEGAVGAAPTLEEATGLAARLVEEGQSRSAAAREAARTTGVPRRSIYEALGGDRG